MNTTNRSIEKAEAKIGVRIKLSALWVALMLLYLYADHFSLFRAGQIEKIVSGQIGPFAVTQVSLLVFSVLMMIPAAMVFFSLTLKPRATRWANIVLGLLYTLVNIGNLVGETWAYYLAFGVVEIVFTLLIVGYAWRWRNPEA